MKTLPVLALALIASCHVDKLFTGGGNGPPLSHGTPVGLAFNMRPGQAREGEPLPTVQVAVVDSAGTPVAGADTFLITIAIKANPGGGTLSGTDTAHAVNGVATFRDLRINKAGNGYTLTASGTGLRDGESAPFNVMPPPPTTGSVMVTTATTGATPDPDGYSVAVDAAAPQPIGNVDSVTFSGLPPGSHAVALTGLAPNCSASGGTSRNVNVTVGDTARVSFAVNCPTPPPTTGDLTVTTTTGGTGTLDPDGYTVAVDGDNRSIAINGSVTFQGLLAGDHSVGLSGVADNCVVSGQNPRTINVPAGGTPQTNFGITCTAPANLPPTAEFIPNCNFLDCSFTSTSSDPDGSIVSQHWDFGDGTTGSGGNPSHTYGAARTYTVTLTVTDNGGATDVATHDVTVTEPPPPPPNQRPVVTAGPEQTVLVSVLFTLEGASFSDPDHNGPWNVTIDWGDGKSNTQTLLSEGSIGGSHSYPVLAIAHDYTLTVTVEDPQGARSSASKTVHVVL